MIPVEIIGFSPPSVDEVTVFYAPANPLALVRLQAVDYWKRLSVSVPWLSSVFSSKGMPEILFSHGFGRVNLKMLPFAGLLSTHILPPCASTIVLAMANPRPEPLASFLPR